MYLVNKDVYITECKLIVTNLQAYVNIAKLMCIRYGSR